MSTVDVQLSFSRARNIVGGSTGSLPYQNATSATLFIPIGANGTVLQSNGSTATWATLGSLTAGAASQVNTIQRTTNSTHFLTFVDSDNPSATAETVYTTSSFTVNPSTGEIDILSNLASTSTNTGALVITGGVGIGRDLYVGGNIALGTLSETLVRTAYTSSNNSKFLVRPGFDINGNGTITSADSLAFNNVLNGVTAINSSTIHELPYILQHFDNTTTGIHVLGQSILNYGLGVTNAGGGQIFLTAGLNNNIRHYLRVGEDPTDNGSVRIKADTTIIGTGTNSLSSTTGALVVTGGVGIGQDLWVGAGVYATTKSFLIPHPTKPGMKLRYGSLEGPENGVYVRGKLTNNNTIELPDHWIKLVDPESITVNLTPIGRHQNLYVETIAENKVIIGNSNLLNKDINCFYTVFAERKDVDKLQVEIY